MTKKKKNVLPERLLRALKHDNDVVRCGVAGHPNATAEVVMVADGAFDADTRHIPPHVEADPRYGSILLLKGLSAAPAHRRAEVGGQWRRGKGCRVLMGAETREDTNQ